MHVHLLQCPVKRVENEFHYLERHDSKKCLVVLFAQNHWGMAVTRGDR